MPVLLKPGQSEARVGVELRLLTTQDLGEDLVDETQSRPHRHVRTVGLYHLGVAREDGNPRADGRLSKVNRGDVLNLEDPNRWIHLNFQGSDELTASGHRSRDLPLATGKNDR